MTEKWKKSDFEIKGRSTGSRLAGRENEYIYEIFWNGKSLGNTFTSKANASRWLGKFIELRQSLLRRIREEEHDV